jgi:hypothetical protein
MSTESPSLTQTSQSVGFYSAVDDKSTSSRDGVQEIDEDVPSFFGVLHKDGKSFRAAVEDCEINYGMNIVQDVDFHSSRRYCIKCKREGCNFFVFARKRTTPNGTGLLALPDDTITKQGKVFKQVFQHSGTCSLCPAGQGTRKVRKVSEHPEVQSSVRGCGGQRRGKGKGMLDFIASLARRHVNCSSMSKSSCSRVTKAILEGDIELQRKSFQYIPSFLAEYNKSNAGSKIDLTTKPDGSFLAMFVSFPANIRAARKCGLRVSAIDGAHSYSPIMTYHVIEYGVLSSMNKNLRLAVGIIEGFERNYSYEYMGQHAREAGITTWTLGEADTITNDEKIDLILQDAERNINLARQFYNNPDTSIRSPHRSEHLRTLQKIHETSANLILHEQQKNALAVVHEDLAAVQLFLQHSPSLPPPPISTSQSPKESDTDVPLSSCQGSSEDHLGEPSIQVDETVYNIGDRVFKKIHNCIIIPGKIINIHLGPPIQYDVNFIVTDGGKKVGEHLCSSFHSNVKVIFPSAYECVESTSLCIQPETLLRVRRGKRRVTRLPSSGEDTSKRGRGSRPKKRSDANKPAAELCVSAESNVSDMTMSKINIPIPGYTFQSLTTKQTHNACFAIALLIGEAFLAAPKSVSHILDMKVVSQIINEDAVNVVEFLRDIRHLGDRDYIDMRNGLHDSNTFGFITGEMQPRYFPTVDQLPPGSDEFDKTMVTVSGQVTEESHFHALVECANSIPTQCYCIIGVSSHYVVLTKSAAGEFALYEGVENVLNEDTARGGLLSSTDAPTAVDMLMYYADRRDLNKQAEHTWFDATIIKPSQHPRNPSHITMDDWRVFYNEVYGKLPSNQYNTRKLRSRTKNKNFGKLDVTRDDLLTLRGGWLNGQVINSFFSLLSERDSKREIMSHYVSSYWLNKLGLGKEYSHENVKNWIRNIPGRDIFNLERLFVPVNRTNQHWTFLCVDFTSQEIFYLDSLVKTKGKYATYSTRCMEAVSRYLEDEWNETRRKSSGMPFPKKEWKCVDTNLKCVPQQNNGSDCGVFVCVFAEHLSRRDDCLDFNQDIMPEQRVKIALSIINKDYFWRFFGDK